MLITDYVPLATAVQAAYRKLPKDQVDYNHMYEAAYWAFESLMTYQVYETNIHLVDVENHTAALPLGLKYIDQIFCLAASDSITVEDIKISVMNEAGTLTYENWDFTNDSGMVWQPMRLSSTFWSKALVTPNSPTISCISEHAYSVGKNRCLITTFESGMLAIGGLSYPMCEGELMIPNHRDVVNALENYLFAEYYQAREFMGMQNAPQEESKYRQRWETLAAKCRGQLMLKSLDQLENFRNQMSRLGSHQETYNNAFSNLNMGENIKL